MSKKSCGSSEFCLPEEICECEQLEDLQILGQSINLPSQVEKLKHLKNLKVDGCVKISLPSKISNCKELVHLDIRGNKDYKFTLPVITNLCHLKSLVAKNTMEVAVIQNCTDLEIIDVASDFRLISQEFLVDFEKLTKLKILRVELGGEMVYNSPLEVFNALGHITESKSLEIVEIKSAFVGKVPPIEFGQMGKLKKLKIEQIFNDKSSMLDVLCNIPKCNGLINTTLVLP